MPEVALPLSLVVFAYDEAPNVPLVLPEIMSWLDGRGAESEVIFVDDGSRDGTGAAAERLLAGRKGARVLAHDRNRGIGAALKTGVRAASLPWVSFLPCDGQVAAAELGHLCAAALADPGLQVVFSVYRDRRDGLNRAVLSAGVRALIRALFAVRLESDGPYLFRRALFDPDLLAPDTFFLNFEFSIRAVRNRLRYAVVPISCRPRRSGASKSVGLRRIAGVARDLVGLRFRI